MAVSVKSVLVKTNDINAFTEFYNSVTDIMVACGLTQLNLPGDAGVFYTTGVGDTKLPASTTAPPFQANSNNTFWQNSFQHPSGFVLTIHYGCASGGWSSQVPVISVSISELSATGDSLTGSSMGFTPSRGSDPQGRDTQRILRACAGDDYFWIFLQPSVTKHFSHAQSARSSFNVPDVGVYIQKLADGKFFVAVPLIDQSARQLLAVSNNPACMTSYLVESGVSTRLGPAFGVPAPNLGATSGGARIIRIPDSIFGERIKIGAIHNSFCTESGAEIAFDLLETGTKQNYLATTSMGPTSPIVAGTPINDAFFVMLPVE